MLTGQTDLDGNPPLPKGENEGAHFDGLGTGAEAKKNRVHVTSLLFEQYGKKGDELIGCNRRTSEKTHDFS
jgi:hypothetical protein